MLIITGATTGKVEASNTAIKNIKRTGALGPAGMNTATDYAAGRTAGLGRGHQVDPPLPKSGPSQTSMVRAV